MFAYTCDAGRDVTGYLVRLLKDANKFDGCVGPSHRELVCDVKEKLAFCSMDPESDTRAAEFEAKHVKQRKTAENYQRMYPM